MPQVNRSALVPFSAKQMYDLVNDVLSYPQFLSGCTGSTLIEHTENRMVASIDIAKVGIKKTFTTQNQLVEPTNIKIELVEGPFKSLYGNWYFTELDETACKIEFLLNFEFTNKMVAMAFGKIFQDVVNNMVQSFIQRARQIYVSDK